MREKQRGKEQRQPRFDAIQQDVLWSSYVISARAWIVRDEVAEATNPSPDFRGSGDTSGRLLQGNRHGTGNPYLVGRGNRDGVDRVDVTIDIEIDRCRKLAPKTCWTAPPETKTETMIRRSR